MKTIRMTTAQALVRYLKVQSVRRDGVDRPFFAGCFGIFGHGNVAGLGQALLENPDFRFIPVRNEQAGVHAAVGYARMRNRLGTFACTSSIGPGATNMITGAAMATIDRLPVLLLPGDLFARRNVAPVLQQLESEHTQDVSVNDCFRPVSRYWDRINRPDQLPWALPEAMRVLTSPADTGAVTLCLPQDVQAEAWDFPAGLFEPRVWEVPRPRADREAIGRAIAVIRSAKRPLIVAGGGVIYSEATDALRRFVQATGIPVAETFAGKGSLRFDHPCSLGGVGVTGTEAANVIAAEADVVFGIGTRYSDFTTSSQTAFQDPDVRFVNLNVAEFDAFKQAAAALVGDARVTLEELLAGIGNFRVGAEWSAKVADLRVRWNAEVERIYHLGHEPIPSQGEVIGVIEAFLPDDGVVINAAGSCPGDLHKLWRARDPKQFHVEYGYSCMGYEIPGAMGIKMAAPEREVCAIVGDGTWLMMCTDLITAIQEGVKLIVVVLDNHGYASIGGLSASVGCEGFGTELRRRGPDGRLDGPILSVDYAAMAAAMGAVGVRARTLDELKTALVDARKRDQTTLIHVETDRYQGIGKYRSWWDIVPAEVSGSEGVRRARHEHETARKRQRCLQGEKQR